MLAADQLGQVLGFLRLSAVAVDLVHTQIAVRAIGQAHGSTGTRNFLHRNHVGEIAHIGSAILLRDGDAQHSQLTKLAPYIHGELVSTINFSRTRRNLALRKVTHGIAQRINIFTELKVQSWQIGKAHGCLL